MNPPVNDADRPGLPDIEQPEDQESREQGQWFWCRTGKCNPHTREFIDDNCRVVADAEPARRALGQDPAKPEGNAHNQKLRWPSELAKQQPPEQERCKATEGPRRTRRKPAAKTRQQQQRRVAPRALDLADATGSLGAPQLKCR